MTDRKTPTRGQSATIFVNGTKRGEGMLLLYPDELAAVIIGSIAPWIYIGVPAAYLAVWYLAFHKIGTGLVAIWYVAGWWIWQGLSRRRAARKVAAGGDGVTIIPLDQVTSIRCRKAWKRANWLGIRQMTVTTADGTEYTFNGLMEQWHDHLAKALSAHGREVYAEAETITVMPCITSGESS
jgi:hypothetical protein